jgi:hypothetical protein
VEVRLAAVVRRGGSSEAAEPVEDIARVSPLAHAHVIPSGTYRFPVRARPGVPPTG